MGKKKTTKYQLIGIDTDCAGIRLSYLIDGVQHRVSVGGTHWTDVYSIEANGDEVQIGDHDLAAIALSMLETIADKWNEFKNDAVFHRNWQMEAEHRKSVAA